MSLKLNELQQEFEDAVGIHEAALAATEGGGQREIPEGTALALITGYIELGNHTGKKAGSKSTPRGIMEFKLFDIEGESDVYTYETKDEEGNTTIHGTHVTHNLHNISRNEKAGFRKDMDALFAATLVTDHTSPIALIGKHVMVDVVHNKSEDGKTTYSNLEVAKCKAPFEPLRTGKPDLTKPLSIPVNPAEVPLRAFVWSAPKPALWASIAIEGTYEKEDDSGKKVEVSKNWIQERIQSADNFSGSPVESMLMQAGSSSAPLPSATKVKNASKPKSDAVVATEPTPSEPEVAEVTTAPVEVVADTVAALSDADVSKLAQLDQMIKMCQDSGMPADQFIAERDLIQAKVS